MDIYLEMPTEYNNNSTSYDHGEDSMTCKNRLLSLMLSIMFAASIAVPRNASAAAAFIHVIDMSQLQYQTFPDGRIYLRNLNTWDSQALIGNYNYYVDTTTVEGKNIYALMLAAIAQATPLWLGLSNGYLAGAVSYVGNW